jgi:hypothetical protein
MAKQPAWEVEQEFRLVTSVYPDSGVQPKERQSGGKTRRYLVTVRDIGKRIAFAEIITGPNHDAAVAQERLKRLLMEQGYKVGELEWPEIVASSLPPWEAPVLDSPKLVP